MPAVRAGRVPLRLGLGGVDGRQGRADPVTTWGLGDFPNPLDGRARQRHDERCLLAVPASASPREPPFGGAVGYPTAVYARVLSGRQLSQRVDRMSNSSSADLRLQDLQRVARECNVHITMRQGHPGDCASWAYTSYGRSSAAITVVPANGAMALSHEELDQLEAYLARYGAAPGCLCWPLV